MRVVIPAKQGSTRCENKNWRDFHGDMCLVDILIEKLIRCDINPEDIAVSSECVEYLSDAVSRWGVSALVRNEYYTDLHTPSPVWIAELMQHVSSDDDVALALCTTPTFNEHKQMIDMWHERDKHVTSVAAAQRAPSHLMIEHRDTMQPVAWSLGSHHTTSQFVLPMYQMMFSFQIMRGRDFKRYAYYTSPDCQWYKSQETHIDINTEQDFADAQAVYASRIEKKVSSV